MTAIFVFAHQDDEFGIFAVIERLVASAGTVHCIYLTDGAYGNQSADRRNNESLRVLGKIGVPRSNVHFLGQSLGIRDGTLHENLSAAFQALQERMKNYSPVSEVYLPAWEGGHQDHDAVHLVGVAASASLGLLDRTFQFSLYHGYKLIGPLFRVMSPLPANGHAQTEPVPWRKRFAYSLLCFYYPSQWKTWIGLLPFVVFKYLTHGKQHRQPVSPGRLLEPPHPGRPLYERRMFLTGLQFHSAKVRFLEQKTWGR